MFIFSFRACFSFSMGLILYFCFFSLFIIFVVLSIVFICATWKVLLLLLWIIQNMKTNTFIQNHLQRPSCQLFKYHQKIFLKVKEKNFIFRSSRRIEQLFTSLFVNDIIWKLHDIITDKRLSTITISYKNRMANPSNVIYI